jgi:glutamate dehydrogenase (NADP+)
LTQRTVNIGGGKGGADFDPKGKSDNEIRRFCQAFMRELSRHIGADTDVPAGDIGVSGREIGYMFGAYRQARNRWEGVLTGKGLDWGGSLIRPEATGYGLVYYVEHMLEVAGRGSFQGKRVAVSGSGNVAQYAALKVLELGGQVVSLSDSQGSLIVDGEGGSFTAEQVGAIAALKADRKPLTAWEAPAGLRYIAGARPWTHVGKVDVALPSATQNEVSGDEARALVDAGVLVVAEGSNMGCTQEAIDVFEAERRAKAGQAVWYAPGKASNCGGVAVSGLEMAQNSQVSRPSIPNVCTYTHGQPPRLTLGQKAPLLDQARGRQQAQGHYAQCLLQRPQHGQGLRSGRRRRAAQPGGRQQHCRLRQGGARHARPGRLVGVRRMRSETAFLFLSFLFGVGLMLALLDNGLVWNSRYMMN